MSDFNTLRQLGTRTISANGNNPAVVDVGNLGAGLYCNVQVVVSAATGTSPTLAIQPQWSNDGTNWDTAGDAAFTTISGTGNTVKQLTPKGMFLRLSETVGGTTPSITYSASVMVVPS